MTVTLLCPRCQQPTVSADSVPRGSLPTHTPEGCIEALAKAHQELLQVVMRYLPVDPRPFRPAGVEFLPSVVVPAREPKTDERPLESYEPDHECG